MGDTRKECDVRGGSNYSGKESAVTANKGSLSHRALEALARPESPDYRQTKPPSRTNTSPQPPKDSMAESGSRQPKEGRSIKEGRRPGHPEEELKAEDRGIEDLCVIHVSSKDHRPSQDNPYSSDKPPPTSPPAQREERWGEKQSN
ncbi:hypothetical protein OsJ_28379 [Oryza sativa Japonica Group]|uniref:Uncharacterized protein n=2 Tax=Oryza sativa subsp. japonica TaxID=39947 RepID=B9G246_ORYSJ|nr:hypothetical protein OsJ_28379 [Oryza sativa Japonica Group]